MRCFGCGTEDVTLLSIDSDHGGEFGVYACNDPECGMGFQGLVEGEPLQPRHRPSKECVAFFALMVSFLQGLCLTFEYGDPDFQDIVDTHRDWRREWKL